MTPPLPLSPVLHQTVDLLFAWVTRASAHTTVVVVLVLLVQAVMGRRLGPRGRYALWGLVIARALAPALPQSPWSVFNIVAPPVATTPIEARVEVRPAGLPPVVVRADPTRADAVRGTLIASTLAPLPSPSPPRSPASSPMSYAAFVWLGGCLAFACAVAISSLAFSRTLRRSPRVADPRVLAILDRCRREFGLRVAPDVLVVESVAGPALAGVWRPRVVVPPGLIERLDDEELRLVFAHELAHLQRRDLLVEWLLVLVRTVHWFNPLVWYAVARCRADRELACDARVLRLCAGAADRGAYGRTILKLAEGLPRGPAARPLAGAVGILEGRRRQLKRRIRMIATMSDGPRAFGSVVAALVVLVLGSCTMTDRRSKPAAPNIDVTIDVPPDELAAATARPTAHGSPIAPAPPDALGRVVRVYDIRDLAIEVPDFTDAPKFIERDASPPLASTRPSPETRPATTQDAFTQERVSRETQMAQVIQLIKDVIEPASWDRPGGAVLRERAGQLIVNAPPETQEQLVQLLGQLRENRAIQITVESRFVAVDDATLAKMTGEMADVFAGNVAPDEPGKPSKGAATFLDAERTAAIFKALQAEGGATIITSPRVTLFNGQRAYVLVATQRAYVRSLTISKDAAGKMSYEPDIGIANSGVILDAGATVSADRKYAVLTLRPQISTLVAMRDAPFPNGPPGEDLHVQIPDLETSEIKTIVSVPDGQTVLLRGLRGSMSLGNDVSKRPEVRNLLLFVKPQIIIQPAESAIATPHGER